MSRRGARLTIAVLFALACGAATWQYLRVDRALSRQLDGGVAFEREARTFATAVVELRGAQQAYVAAGQGGDFWTTRVTRDLASLRGRLDTLRRSATAADALTQLDIAGTALDGFARVDRRARDYAVADQRLLASDLIFGDGLETTRSIAGAVDAAREAEAAFRSTGARRLRAQQQLLAGGVSGLAMIFLLILALAVPPPPRPNAAELAPTRLNEIAPPPEPRAILASRLFEPSPEAVAPAVDLPAAAELCVDLARVSDTEQMPALLERMTRVLDARGIVLWIADPDGRELVPTVAHGYPAASIGRLGTIQRDADNATAAAFRESRVHTVKGDRETNGAVVAPLVTAGGCIGVMAAEVRNLREQRDEVRAIASIMAAQLATLIGVTPVAQPHAKAN